MGGRKIELPKIANSLCQNNLKKLSWYMMVHHLLWIIEACKKIFVHLPLRKKIIQRSRRMRLEFLGAFSYGA
jgi:hypothetical protein